jgi:hypothetical protein
MLQFSVYLIPRQPLFEIKAVVGFKSLLREDNKEAFVTVDTHNPQFGSGSSDVLKLEMMRDKLEQIIPPSYRPKYRITKEQLITSMMTHLSTRDAQRLVQRMEEFIHEAAHALHFE